MFLPYLHVQIGDQLLPDIMIYDFRMTASIESAIPEAELILNDTSGIILASLPMSIGTRVYITIAELMDANSKQDQVQLSPFVISKIMHDSESNIHYMGGFMTLKLQHPWDFYKDYHPHAYPPLKISELIRRVLQDTARGFTFSIDEDNFATSDDLGSFPRYKINESDYDFIFNKLLPYTVINGDPAYFFIDDLGHVKLSSFQRLINSDFKGALIPYNIGEEYEPLVEQVLEDISRPAASAFGSAFLAIGGSSDSDYIAKMKPKFYFEDPGAKQYFTAFKTPSTRVAKENGPTSGNKTPIDMPLLATMDMTDSMTLMNRAFDDQKALAVNYTKDLDKMFRITLATSFVASEIPIGSSVYLILPPLGKEVKTKKSLSHWLNGKWLVHSSEHSLGTPGELNTMTTKINLIRPTFVLKDSNTTLNAEISATVWEA